MTETALSNFDHTARYLERLQEVGYAAQVDARVFGVVTRLQDYEGNPAAGNLSRRYCPVPETIGASACTQVCFMRQPTGGQRLPEDTPYDDCADDHLFDVLSGLGVPKGKFVKFLVGDNHTGVGFADSTELKPHVDGHRETAEKLNAFFFKVSDDVEAVACFGRDGGSFVLSARTRTGERAAGQIFSMRDDMRFGPAQDEYDGERRTYVDYALGQFIQHYDIDPESIKVRLVAAVSQWYTKHFADQAKMDRLFPGWVSSTLADNYMTNLSNKDWKPGEPFQSTDIWLPDYPGATRRLMFDAARKHGVPLENLKLANPLDPSAEGGTHSSHVNVRHGRAVRETADGYFAVMI